MRSLVIIAGAALALSACGDRNEADTNNMVVEDLAVDNLVINDGMGMDANLTGNMAVDPATENMVVNDLTTNDVDTNLANGL